MVCQKLLMIQPPVAFLVPTVLLLSLYFFVDFNFFLPLLLFARGSTLFRDVIAVAKQRFQKFPSTSIFFGLLHLLQSDFLFLSYDYSEKARIRTFPFDAHVTFVVLLTGGHSSGMG
jgi:hypothetical protein